MLEVTLVLSEGKLINSSANAAGLEKVIYDWKYSVINSLANNYTDRYVRQSGPQKKDRFKNHLMYGLGHNEYNLSVEKIEDYLKSSIEYTNEIVVCLRDIQHELKLVNLLKNLTDNIIQTGVVPEHIGPLNIDAPITEEKRTELYAILLKKLYDAGLIENFFSQSMTQYQYNVFVINRTPFSAVMIQKIENEIKFVPFTSSGELVKEYKRNNNYSGLLLAFKDLVDAQGEYQETQYFLFADKTRSIIPPAILSSSSWVHTMEHAKRQQERKGDGFWYKKTEFAKQKEILLVFLESISTQRFLVDSDFWLTVEAQAFYTDNVANPEQYPFLGAFHASPRHSSQTVERYKELKSKWYENIIVDDNKKIGENTDDLRVKLSKEKRAQLLEKIKNQINALEIRLNPPSNGERTSIFHQRESLSEGEKAALGKQKEIFKALQQFLFSGEQNGLNIQEPLGLTAEDWVIARCQLMQSSPNKMALETFNEIYEAWHAQAILTMQKKMSLDVTQYRMSINNRGF